MQNVDDMEVILVDDGSPDNCGKMCDDYVRLAFTMDENIIIKGIHRIVEFVHSL